MDLSEALLRAKGAYREELDMIANRNAAMRRRGRLRKLSRNKPYEKLTEEAREEIDWWRAACLSFPKDTAAALDYLSGKRGMLSLGAGVTGYAALQRAGFILLDWLDAQGETVTAMKFGTNRGDPGPNDNLYYLSYAVDFLAEQLVLIEPSLEVSDTQDPLRNLAIDAAYRVTEAWRKARGTA